MMHQSIIVGYGGNKAARLFEMYMTGILFYILSDHFIITTSTRGRHDPTVSMRLTSDLFVLQRKYNRKIYDSKDEACLRYAAWLFSWYRFLSIFLRIRFLSYLTAFHDRRMLNFTLAENTLTECKKISDTDAA